MQSVHWPPGNTGGWKHINEQIMIPNWLQSHQTPVLVGLCSIDLLFASHLSWHCKERFAAQTKKVPADTGILRGMAGAEAVLYLAYAPSDAELAKFMRSAYKKVSRGRGLQ